MTKGFTFFLRLAEIAGEYLKKGRPVYVEGRLKYGKFTNKDGIEQNTVDIIATEMQLLGGRESGGMSDDDGGAPRRSAPPASRPAPRAFSTAPRSLSARSAFSASSARQRPSSRNGRSPSAPSSTASSPCAGAPPWCWRPATHSISARRAS